MTKNYKCKECGENFEVLAAVVKFAVCPACGTDDIDNAEEPKEQQQGF